MNKFKDFDGKYRPARQQISERGLGSEQVFPGSEYSEEETEFLLAIDRYKRTKGRPHPTWREVLNVLRDLGWRRGGCGHCCDACLDVQYTLTEAPADREEPDTAA